MSEIQKVEGNLKTVSESSAIISMIERVATDPNADLNKLEKMIELQERITDRNARQAFSADFAAMQAELPRILKNGKSHNGAYALLEDINDGIRPVLQKHGFAPSFRVDQSSPDFVLITAKLSHRDGFFEETSISLPLDKSGSKNGVQAVGSTISYGKRYALSALLNISTGDDTDGNPIDNALQQADSKAIEKFIHHNQVLRDNLESVMAIKQALAEENYEYAAECWLELAEETRLTLTKAATKGGIWTLEETKKFRSDEYKQFAYNLGDK